MVLDACGDDAVARCNNGAAWGRAAHCYCGMPVRKAVRIAWPQLTEFHPSVDNGASGAMLRTSRATTPSGGSPAIDAGANPFGLDTDQRGEGYARVIGPAADIGAYEVQTPSDVIFINGFEH